MDDQDCRLCLLSGYHFAVGTGLGDSTLLEGKPCFPFHSVTTRFTRKHPSSQAFSLLLRYSPNTSLCGK